MRLMGLVVVVAVGAACQPDSEWSSPGPSFSTAGNARAGVTAPALWGTSVVTLADGRVAVADPDGDAVWLLRADASPVKLLFPSGSAPSRVVEAGKELAVVLRGAGKVARLAITSHGYSVAEGELESACAEPRGLVWDGAAKALVLACASGELVTFTATERTTVDTGLELNDVVLAGGRRWVTTFRDAELLELDSGGQVVTRLAPPRLSLAAVTFTPRVAWRAIADGDRVLLVHQLHVDDEVTKLTNPGPTVPYYGTPYCTASVVTSALTVFDGRRGSMSWSAPLVGALPVDVAVGGGRIAVAFVGADRVLEYDDVPDGVRGSGGCLVPTSSAFGVPTGVGYANEALVWFDRAGTVRGLDPAADTMLSREPREMDPARALFHTQSPSGVACASCHPDGHDDGHTWRFGQRVVRSQSLEGGLLSTAPFHWDGRFRDLGAVLDETLVLRMGGEKPDVTLQHELGAWLDALPARAPARVDLRAARVGRALFEKLQCAGCHSGPELTNKATVDVGTGGRFQVPSLKALRWRGPWMHDGCAKTLADRFDPACGGGALHGASVASEDVPELVEYLKTL